MPPVASSPPSIFAISPAPVAPSGCPCAIAPPHGLTLSISGFSSFAQDSTTDANASLISIQSISPIETPAFLSASCAAGITPVSCRIGSEPTATRARNRAFGLSPSALAASALAIRTADAPSDIWLELAAVMTPLPSGRNAGLSERILASSTTARMPSSRSSSIGCASGETPGVGRISRFSRFACAAAARRWLSFAKSSSVSRDRPHFSATRSALSPWWIRSWRRNSSGFSFSKPWFSCPSEISRNIGARVMLSTPQPIT